MPTAAIIIFMGLLIFFGHYLSGMFERRGIPDVLGLIVIGLLIGPVAGWIVPASFGKIGPVFSNLVLIFILFESGTDLKVDEIKASFRDTAGITFFGFLSTAFVLAIACKIIFDLHPLSCLFLGTALGGTSSAVVVGLARRLPIKPRTTTTLIMESAETDLFTLAIPISILAIMQESAQVTMGNVLWQFFSALIMALIIGVGGAFLWSFIVNKIPYLKSTKFSTPAFLFILYGGAEYLQFSGPLTALSFGVAIGNLHYLEPGFIKKIVPNQNIVLPQAEKDFFAELIFLLRIFFFVFIGISIQIERLDWLAWSALITAALIFVRLLLVKLLIHPSAPVADKAAISIMIPKGLGAAVVATLPMQHGLPDGFILQSIGFGIILFSTLYCVLLYFLLSTGISMPLYQKFFGQSKSSSDLPTV